MIRRLRSITVLVIGAVAAIAACTDVDRLPTAGSLGVGSRTRSLGVQVATPATRISPLAAPETWSFTVGPEGGVSRNETAGLTIIVPAGAVDQERTITVTALAGPWVAYRFEPHIEFGTNVLLVQDRASMRGGGLVFGGAHFDGEAPEVANGTIVVNELASAVTSLLNGTVIISVGHFSGWIVTTGNEEPPKDNSGTS